MDEHIKRQIATDELSMDRRPKTLPEIVPVGAGVAYMLRVAALKRRLTLVVRCDEYGEVWASIR